MNDQKSLRVLKLHHPTGHPYWQADEFDIELPDGTFYNKKYCDPHRIIVEVDGIYYQRCGASSGGGKTNYKEPFKIIDSIEYDVVHYEGTPLIMSETLVNDIKKFVK